MTDKQKITIEAAVKTDLPLQKMDVQNIVDSVEEELLSADYVDEVIATGKSEFLC